MPDRPMQWLDAEQGPASAPGLFLTGILPMCHACHVHESAGGEGDARRASAGGEGDATRDEQPVIRRLPGLTPRRIIFGTLAWLGLFTIGSVGVANPFEDEKSATAAISYWHVMYLHGMLIGMVGVTLLLAISVFDLRWRHAWVLIPLGVVVATLLATVGGVFDHNIPGSTGDHVATWVQILSFFTLDEMLIVIGVAFFIDWRAHRPGSRRASFMVAWVASVSMLIAAIMGHLAGWILEFGDRPAFIGTYARFVGESVATLESNLVTSHSHEMTVAFMVLAVAVSVAYYAERSRVDRCARLRSAGLWLALLGTLAFTAVYVWAGFTTWTIPTLFPSHNGVNGLALDDLLTGIAMIGGLLALAGAFLARSARLNLPAFAAAWGWLLTILLVVVTGYWIELHETHYGAGRPAPGAASDALFTWFHQDVGLFLFPCMTVVMLVTARYVLPKHQWRPSLLAVVGSSVLFAGGMVYLFVDHALHGSGYAISTVGLAAIGASFLGTIWWGLFRRHAGAGAGVPPPSTPSM